MYSLKHMKLRREWKKNLRKEKIVNSKLKQSDPTLSGKDVGRIRRFLTSRKLNKGYVLSGTRGR
jgi:hypothetical protein